MLTLALQRPGGHKIMNNYKNIEMAISQICQVITDCVDGEIRQYAKESVLRNAAYQVVASHQSFVQARPDFRADKKATIVATARLYNAIAAALNVDLPERLKHIISRTEEMKAADSAGEGTAASKHGEELESFRDKHLSPEAAALLKATETELAEDRKEILSKTLTPGQWVGKECRAVQIAVTEDNVLRTAWMLDGLTDFLAAREVTRKDGTVKKLNGPLGWYATRVARAVDRRKKYARVTSGGLLQAAIDAEALHTNAYALFDDLIKEIDECCVDVQKELDAIMDEKSGRLSLSEKGMSELEAIVKDSQQNHPQDGTGWTEDGSMMGGQSDKNDRS